MHSKQKIKLFYKSSNFCSAPWNLFKISENGDISTCVYGEVLTNINTDNDSIETILSSNSTLCDIRANLSNNIPDNNCVNCQQLEQSDYKFLRNLYNPMFADRDVNYLDSNEFKLGAVDLHWSNTCQLKCITCWSKQSSSIAKEEGKPILNISSKKANAVIKFIVKNQHTLKELYLSGGEPTLINHNYNLLRQLDSAKLNPECIIRVNTNMMFESDNKVINELKRFPNVLITISADGVCDRFEYIRRDASWGTFINNLTILQTTTNFKWRLNLVFSVASALYLTDTIDYFATEFNINNVTINQLGHNHINILCRNLPKITKLHCIEKFQQYTKKCKNNNLLGQIANCLNELNKDNEMPYNSFFENIDKKANTNWLEIFPELIQ